MKAREGKGAGVEREAITTGKVGNNRREPPTLIGQDMKYATLAYTPEEVCDRFATIAGKVGASFSFVPGVFTGSSGILRSQSQDVLISIRSKH